MYYLNLILKNCSFSKIKGLCLINNSISVIVFLLILSVFFAFFTNSEQFLLKSLSRSKIIMSILKILFEKKRKNPAFN